MHRLFIYLSFTIFVTVGCQQKTTRSPEQIKNSVDSLLTHYQTAVNSGDKNSTLSVYSNDPRFHWVEDGNIAYHSAEEVKEGLKKLKKVYSQFHLELSKTTITPLPPNYASVTTHFNQSLADSSGNKFSFSGIMTITVAKEQEGWKFLIGHTSSSKQ